jgi:hypothetical protein
LREKTPLNSEEPFVLIGLKVVDFLGGDDYATSLVLSPDGKIVMGAVP